MKQVLKLVRRNVLRHPLRTSLTLAGLVIAILSFGLLQTIVDEWYVGVDGAVPSRLIIRNAATFTLPLPSTYKDRIRRVDGVRGVTHLSWFAGIYKEPKNFFPQFAVDPDSHLSLYPEIILSTEARQAFQNDRRGAIVGRKLADRFGFKLGDAIELSGTIFPGKWDFVIRGIFDGQDPKTDTSQFLFHWDYLNETLRTRSPSQADQVGFFVVDASEISRLAEISQSIDKTFYNSSAETLTETERAFQIGFVRQTEAILISIQFVSFIVILIVFAVMANTMSMAAQERLSEYSTLKAIGFSPAYVAGLILTESLMVAALGGALAIALTFPAAACLAKLIGTLFPHLIVGGKTIALQAASAFTVGLLAAIIPMRRAAAVRIVDGLRWVG